ncbi:uncharacterized protein QC763_203910 [Podospora pseudopauciseta]|uniref:Uncharacterized protein n=1 Tax=Podospora pseudopauciseta TaxID=2093780 RepID=A0ABR0HN59_9PEZI|nr:hypothetical protein QC763_203910 [Podospora pseudopauciseta]
MLQRFGRGLSRPVALESYTSSCGSLRTYRQLHNTTRREAEDSRDNDEKSAYERSVESLNIDPENKTVTTVVGNLPLSPIMDPEFHEARNNFTKPKPKHAARPKDKFRRQLERNPYARMLAERVRTCDITGTPLPKPLLQRFKLGQDPTTETTWWMPQDLESKVPKEGGDVPAATELPGPSAYTLNSRLFLQELVTPKGMYSSSSSRLLRATESGTGRYTSALNNAQWRKDMDTYLLETMRKRVFEGLIHAAHLAEKGGSDGRPRKYVTKLNSWNEVSELKQRQCVLFFGPPEGLPPGPAMASVPSAISTMAIKGSKFGEKIAVHDMRVVLGREHLAKLRQESTLLQDGSLYMLRGQASMRLNMLIWKLQEYIAGSEDSVGEVDDGETVPQRSEDSAAELVQPQEEDWESLLDDDLDRAEDLRD